MRAKKLVLLLMLIPTVLMADSYQNYSGSYSDSMCSGWFSDVTIYGDWLFWRARRSNLDYAIPFVTIGDNSSVGNVFKVTPNYRSGFRVGARKACGCTDVEVRYTHFRPDWTDSVSDPSGELAGTRIENFDSAVNIGDISFAEGKWKLDYDQVDLIAGYNFCSLACLTSRIFGGFTWARIDQEFKATYEGDGNSDRVRQLLDMNAYGLNVGADVSYQFLSCLNFFGAFWYNALLGDFRGRWIYNGVFDTGDFAFVGNLRDDTWEMLSVFNLAFGMQYRYSFCFCFVKDLALSIGYEFHHWINMPDFLAINGTDGQMILDRRVNFDFDGLFVRFSIGF